MYFDEKVSAKDTLLANYPTVLTRTDFSTTITNTTTGTIYYADTSKGRTYYFAGNPMDNWISFADFYWRIIRINEDGSLKLIYSGNGSSQTTGLETQAETSVFNNTYRDNMYVGYMYENNQVHGLSNSSTIKEVLDTWYQNNLKDYADKIDGNAGFCGDRTPSTNIDEINNQGGTGTTTTYYGYIRLITNKQPTFECKDEDGGESDLYTTKGSEDGNKALTYPIGLITADEVAYAGGVYNSNNRNFYLYTNSNYWTLTPDRFIGLTRSVFIVNNEGMLNYGNLNNSYGVRPVINLNDDITLSGSGTATDPYTVN